MAVTISEFDPSTPIKGGRNGLIWTRGSTSDATIHGSELVNGLAVTVLFPRQSQNPKIKWTGTTANSNSDNTQCTVQLTEQLDNNGPSQGPTDDDNTSVSVTVGTATTDTTVPVGTAPSPVPV